MIELRWGPRVGRSVVAGLLAPLQVLSPPEARRVVERLARASWRSHAPRLRSLLGVRRRDVSTLDDVEVRAELVRYAAQGELRVLREPRQAWSYTPSGDASPASVDELGPSSEREKPTEWTWIEVLLEGEDCRPIPGERYRITLPDGSVREGTTDGAGRARVDTIDNPGQCKIVFPDLDQDAWTSDYECPPPRVDPELTFVEFALIDMEGSPIPHERFRITLADGSVHEGRLDASGRVRYDGILAGDCKITFPELDAEAWELVDG